MTERIVTHRYLDDHYTKDKIGEESYKWFTAVKIRLMATPSLVFWGVTMTNLVYVEDRTIQTLATDGAHIYVNPEFFLKLRDGEKERGIAHEVHHAITAIVPLVVDGVVLHRRGDRDSILWNIAADHRDNLDLEESHVGEPFTTIQVYQDPKYADMSVEEIYDDLEKNPPDEKTQKDKKFDDHFVLDIAPPEQGSPGKDKPGQEEITQAVYEKLVRSWERTIQQAHHAQKEAEAMTGQPGYIPSYLRRFIEGLREARYDWVDLLKQNFEHVITRGFSIDEPNKAYFNQGISVEGPRARKKRLNVAVFDDTSASLDVVAQRVFLGEIKGILEQHKYVRALLGSFDAAVHEDTVVELTERELDRFDDFHNDLRGGGGTVFESVFEYLINREIRPRVLIIFTDGEPAFEWGVPDFCPTIFVIKNKDKKIRAPFGETIHYDGPTEEKKDE
jgi:predicted metal-dependent peptidase